MNRINLPNRSLAPELVALVAFAAALSCGPAGTDGTGSGGAATGGSAQAGGSSSGGASTIGLAPEMDIVTPDGPGDSEGQLCPSFECTGSSFDQPWTLDQRCDSSGTWADPECPAAAFSWTLVDASGSFLHGSTITWKISTTTDWTVSYPASCGGCTALETGRLAGPFASFSEQLMSSWQSLDCQEDAQGDCQCVGTLAREEDYYGQGVGDEDENGETAGRYLIREYPSAKNASYLPVEHRIKLCAGDGQLVAYDENGAHYYFTGP